MKERIGIYGGAFDPLHFGHLKVITHALAVADFTYLWVLPSREHPFGKQMAPFAARMLMLSQTLEAVFGPVPSRYAQAKVLAQDFEQAWQTKYTYDTIERLIAEFGTEADFTLILGPDQNLSQWYRGGELAKMVDVITIPDQGPIRSTLIRDAIQAGKVEEIQRLVPPAVLQVIREQHLYAK